MREFFRIVALVERGAALKDIRVGGANPERTLGAQGQELQRDLWRSRIEDRARDLRGILYTLAASDPSLWHDRDAHALARGRPHLLATSLSPGMADRAQRSGLEALHQVPSCETLARALNPLAPLVRAP